MLLAFAYALTILLAMAVIVVGVRLFFAPRAAAKGYRVVLDGAGMEGLRDLTFGLGGLALLAVAGPYAVAWFFAIVAIAPVGDTLIVLWRGGSRAVAFGVHLATAAAMWVAAALLFAL